MNEKSIIEKLGITPGPWRSETEDPDYGDRSFVAWEDTECDDTIICEAKYGMNDAKLIAAAPEMLERDIFFVKALEKMKQHYWSFSMEREIKVIDKVISIFELGPDEKATNKPWEQIKELIK